MMGKLLCHCPNDCDWWANIVWGTIIIIEVQRKKLNIIGSGESNRIKLLSRKCAFTILVFGNEYNHF